MSEHDDEKLVLGLLRKLLGESYSDTYSAPHGRKRFLIDGSTYDVTDEELAALDRWWDRQA